MRQQIFSEVEAERQHQEQKWGNDFDDRNTPYNWSAYIGRYATRNLIGEVDPAKFRADMVKVAALAVAAIEAYERNAD